VRQCLSQCAYSLLSSASWTCSWRGNPASPRWTGEALAAAKTLGRRAALA
jgi:hypothetical protein